jgi:hypothetical protein
MSLLHVDQLNVSSGLSSVGAVRVSENGRLKGYFCSENVFNLSHKILSDVEINILGKGLEFVPTSFKVNYEMDLREDFQEFSRRMRCKWHFKDNVTPDFSEIPAFRPKSTWTPPEGCPALELFLSQIENLRIT